MKHLVKFLVLSGALATVSCTKEMAEVQPQNPTAEKKIVQMVAIPSMGSADIAQKFSDRTPILGKTQFIISLTQDPYKFQLGYRGDYVKLTNNKVDLSSLTSESLKEIFQAFFTRTPYMFKGYEVTIVNVKPYGTSKGDFSITGETNVGELVRFSYFSERNNGYWTTRPTLPVKDNGLGAFTALDVIQRFHSRLWVHGNTYKTVKRENASGTFIFAEGSDTRKVVVNQPVSLSQLKLEGSDELLTAFFNNKPFTFKGTKVIVTKLDRNDHNYFVTGTTQDNGDEVSFSYDPEDSDLEWYNAPNIDVKFDKLVQDFADGTLVVGGISIKELSMKSHSDYTLELLGEDRNTKAEVVVEGVNIDLSSVASASLRNVFKAYLTRSAFTLNGDDIKRIYKVFSTANGPEIVVHNRTQGKIVRLVFDKTSDTWK